MQTQPYQRIFNFSAGPANMPVPVLEKARDELLNYRDSGCSVMEMSHRSEEFLTIIQEAEKNLRDCLGIPDGYSVLFLQGGASLQFCMVPLNLSNKDKTVDVIQTGSWTKKATKEIQKISQVNIAASSEEDNFLRLPKKEEMRFLDDSAYVHIASNNTIFGTQMKVFPDTGDVPLVADMSSDILSRKINISRFGLIFAGAQKNLGPAGVTLVIIRNDLMERTPQEIPIFLQYSTHAKANSLYNTPPTFGIYILGLVLEWVKSGGGLDEIEKNNQEKSNLLYKAIDESDFYSCPIPAEDRSNMNVVFRIREGHDDSETIEKKFAQEAKEEGIINIKGHRSVGGLRASIYNAMPLQGIQHLVDFMDRFAKKR